ncbi:site-specific DNA-methyltransferase [Lacrimispora amygdalina]|uniref:Site-specific DNA-methyltransferase n=1 Tax=Lacrimispora amygdalina TaxID=253257 RepID=A0A3E2N6C6_9FIRM|nr:site-specific DNA-methyltransferase [Clostridium indicum]RFZ76451.1 site-specific DNA-methyltransferase [Clostridium indicum]
MNKNIFEIVEEVLNTNSKYISDDGKLLKAIVYSDVMTMNKELLSLLLSDEKIKERFFENVNGTLVFDKQKFAWFIESKEFLPDSYTKYTNKIGLTNGGDFISKSNDVVLDFPYKDCVLEGGQDKEDQKRKEIFYNETIASDEISKMLAPKVFTNAKRYTKDGVEENITFNENDNLIIKGNNLIALSSLLKRYEGKVKCIYIDPPYNTGSDSFGYNDSFSYSTWLAFMKNRLELAQRLLSKDGLIFISIDSSRQNANGIVGTSALPYLNILMDELFGRENFIGHLHWKKKKQPSFLSRIAGVMESVLVYAKEQKNVGKLQMGAQSDATKRIDNASNKAVSMKIKAGIRYMGDKNSVIKKGIYQNKTMSTEFLQDVYIKNGRVTNDFEAIAKYRNSQEEITKFCDLDLLYITANNSFRRYKTEEEEKSGKTITDLLLDWGQNQDATEELRKLFNITNDDKAFDNPKPELLISNIINVSSGVGDLIMDFHLGSGTTCAVAHKMGRRYIGVEQMDYIEDITVERMKKVIDGEQGGISKSVDWQGGGSFVYCELLENASTLIKKIQEASEEIISEIKNEIYADERIVPYITREELKKADEEFNSLELQEKKKALISLVDKNKLYVNYSDMDDESYDISESDKAFTKSFYAEV